MADLDEREGADITAYDMIVPEQDPSEIAEFYKDSTILLTGATGFLGRMFLEKLLRACKDLKRIYILIRPKKGKDTAKRFEEIFEGPSFEMLKRKQTNFLEKVSIVNGDLCQPFLGLSEGDKAMLISEVNCIIHCAATVRFDEHIRTATSINVRSVRDLIHMAKQMKNLKVMLYISTAFSNCIQKEIDEKFYEPPITGEKLTALVDCLDDEKLAAITPTLLGEYPNTYVYTKAVAENVINAEAKNLPIGIFRPSIVLSSFKEPVAGWIDNLYGATGILMGAAVGVLRSLHGKKENRADMVPADYVVNSAIAATFEVATMKSLNDNKETRDQQSREEKFDKEIPIYNYVCTPERPITWDLFERLSDKHGKRIPSQLCVWYYCFALRPNRWVHLMAVFFLHMIPAYLVDFGALCIGKKPFLVKSYEKIHKFSDVIAYFTMRQWDFKNNNTQALWNRLNKTDREQFEFSMGQLDWDSYFYTYMRGGRTYLLKDPIDTVPQGMSKYRKLFVLHYALISLLYLLLFWFVYKCVSVVFNF